MTIAPLDAEALAKVFLPRLLPAAWQNQRAVRWAPASEASGEEPSPRGSSQPSREWMRGLWGMLGDLRGFQAASSWPLVPVQGGLLCQPRLSSAVRHLDAFVSAPRAPAHDS